MMVKISDEEFESMKGNAGRGSKARRGLDSPQLLEKIKEIISSYDTKLTVRQIYYQLVSKQQIENVISQYIRVCKILVEARHNGEVRWNDIEDRTRQETGGDYSLKDPESYYENQKEEFMDSWDFYTVPMWLNQPYYVEIWFEKQALEGIFKKVTDKYNVTQLACKGYSSHTMGYRLGQRLKWLDENEDGSKKKVKIYYFGDYDPSGLDIYRFIQDMSRRFGLEIEFERVAITKEQIEKYNIPPAMAKKSDSRYEGFVVQHGDIAVELDALEPNVLMKFSFIRREESTLNKEYYELVRVGIILIVKPMDDFIPHYNIFNSEPRLFEF